LRRKGRTDVVKRTPTRLRIADMEIQPSAANAMADFGKLAVRGLSGALLVGHGVQKLFGFFEGPGLNGMAQAMESMRLRPGKLWAFTAGASEAGGGALMGTGALHPLGPILTISAMVMAVAKGHWGKPIWAHAGGGELPLTNAMIATEQLLQGPGRYSVDSVLGIKLPRWVAIGAGSAAAAALAYGLWQSRPVPPPSESAPSTDEAAVPSAEVNSLTTE
jgi:putative oxidoreductase